LNSVVSTWYVDLKIGSNTIIQEPFFTGYGNTDVPTTTEWRNALLQYLPNLYNYGYTFFIQGNIIKIMSMTATPIYIDEVISLNVGISFTINCTTVS
jgi:hypothetical protein